MAARCGLERVEQTICCGRATTFHCTCRAAPNTAGLIGPRELALMKPTAFLINTARAVLIDQQALYAALANGRIAGAGLDTLADHGFDTPLLTLPNVVGTPHLGNRCEDSIHAVMDMAIDNTLPVLHGEQPQHTINPDVFSKLKIHSNT